MQNDDFHTILDMKMKGYQPSEALLMSLQDKVSSNTFIAVARIFGIEGALKNIPDVKLAQSRLKKGNVKDMEKGFQ